MIESGVILELLAADADPVEVLRRGDALNPEALEALVREATVMARSRPDAAGRLVEVARHAATLADAPSVVPAADYLEARLVLEAGEPERALDLIRGAAAAYRELGLVGAAIRTHLGRMHALDDLGRHEEAVAVGRSVLAHLDQSPEAEQDTGLRAATLGNVGVGLGFTGDHLGALAAYQDAEALWRSLTADHEASAAVANQGIELLALGRWGDALTRLSAAAELFEQLDDRFWLAKCLGHRGEALTGAGRFVEALADYQRARAILDELGSKTESWRLALETSATLLLLGLVEEACLLAAQVEPELRAAGLQHDLARALSLAGLGHLRAGRRPQAREALGEALSLYRTVGDAAHEAKSLIDLSGCVDGPAARELAEAAAALVDRIRWPGISCLALLALADHTADRTQAKLLARQAEEIADALAIPHLQLATIQRRGTALLADGSVDAAIACFEQSLSLVERGGTGIRDATLHAAYRSSRQSAHNGLIDGLLRRGSPQDVHRAFELVDQVKGGTVLEVLQGTLHPRTMSDATRLATLELNAAYSDLFVSDRDTQKRLRSQIAALERGIALTQARLPPASTHRSRSTARPPDATGTTAVTYYVLGEEVLAFVTHHGRTTLRRRICGLATVESLLHDLETHVGGHAVQVISKHGHARIGACQRVLERLYLAVLAPLVDLLPDGSDSPAPLLVTPHGPLYRIPFHALHDGHRYLLASRIISVAPSLAVAGHAVGQGRRHGGLLAVGVADSAAEAIESEARAIGDLTSRSTVLLGPEATAERVRSALASVGVAHLACHGAFRPGNPAFSSIRLADQWVRAADLADVDLDGCVLVLSACETGRMESPSGDEAVGLAASLLAAGAYCVVVSQWLADDSTTAHLMIRLHTGLAAGLHPAAALRQAQLSTMQDHPHPFHWAPFIAVGAPDPAEHPDASNA